MLKIVCVLAFASVFAAPAVYAEPISNERITTTTVPVSDIDFTSSQQVGMLYSRLNEASRAVCETPEPGAAFRAADDRACEREAVHDAVRSLNQPLLTEMDARTGLAAAQPERSAATRRETR